MLQQILQDMWVDPEILAELDDTQKQTLFCKMREEQVRRWQLWDEKLSKAENDQPNMEKNGKKHVKFLNGEDGEPWVWVMGEHPDDKSIDTIIAEEAQRRTLAQVREEAHQLRKSVEKEFSQLIEYSELDRYDEKFKLSPKCVESIEDSLEIYCAVDELRQRIDDLETEVDISEKTDLEGNMDDKSNYCKENHNIDIKKNNLNFNFIEGKRDVLQEIGLPAGGDAVSNRVAAWERRVAAVRATDILRGLRARRAKVLRDQQENEYDAWLERERKAKEAEERMREVVRAAREAHRQSTELVPPALPISCLQAGKPPNIEAIIEWFKTCELPRGAGLDENKQPVSWFHGIITRAEAEEILSSQPAGSFLVRVSERIWGYAVSWRGAAYCKHFLVEAPHSQPYRLLAPSSLTHRHQTLVELINFYKKNAITENGGELLKTPCPPAQTPAMLDH